MAINSIWVFAQTAGGAPTTGTLELLTKARSLSSNVSAFIGGDASAVAGALGEYGATKVYATGDLAGKLPGPAVSAAMKSVIDGGDSPSIIMFPQNYEGRDVMAAGDVLRHAVQGNHHDRDVVRLEGLELRVKNLFLGALGQDLRGIEGKRFVEVGTRGYCGATRPDDGE